MVLVLRKEIVGKMKILLLLFFVGVVVSFTISTILSALNSTPDEEVGNSHLVRSSPEWPEMDSSYKNIFWVVQISDLHLSVHKDPNRGPDLLRLCRDYISLIDPELVIITGDLTDAKDRTNLVSTQNVKEWELYHRIVKSCQEMTRAKWIDIRGNHDVFDVYNFNSENNHYRRYSAFDKVLDDEHRVAVHHKLHMPFGNYSFIGFDASSTPGSNRPFNFFGYLDDKQVNRIKQLSQESQSSNHTVWFAHFPTSLIVHNPPVLRSVMRESVAYLCGHLHTLGDMVPRMYSRQKTGQLELELGDWKDNRRFRVIAFDHDLMSFVDAKLGDWPLVLITNPKNSQFFAIGKEPIEMIQESSHIRILVFNPDPIQSVQIKIDGVYEGEAEHVKGPLFVKEWNPHEYNNELHTIQVVVRDQAKRKKVIRQHFSMTRALPEFDFVPRFLLMLNIFSLGKIAFGVMVFSFTFILTSFRQCSNIRPFYLQVPIFGPMLNSILMKIWLASQATSIYTILIGCVLYLTFGPWFYGELLKGHHGIVFAWGIAFEAAFIPSGITYFYGIFQVLFFNLPLLFLLGHILDSKRKMGHRFVFRQLYFTIIYSILLFLFWVYITMQEFPRAYGQKAFYMGPLRVGCCCVIPISIWLSSRYDFKIPLAVNGGAY